MTRMRLLALDTSTSAITVAVHDGSDVLSSGSVVDARRHTERLAPLVEDVLRTAECGADDLTDIAVGTGPGPFTGLRVGLVSARVLAWSLGIPVHGVCSLDALAHGAVERGLVDERFVVATDARRKEVYWATYEPHGSSARRLTDPAVCHPAALPQDVRALAAVGRGPALYPESLPRAVHLFDVDAESLADLAVRRISSGEPMPVDALYLRRPDALTTAERGAR